MQLVLPQIAEAQQAMWVKREKQKRRRRVVREVLVEYAKHSTLHGLRYTTERALSPCEKVFWAATFVASAALCGYLISNVYDKWATSPVIVTIGERLVSAGSIPFPAVTICPQMKIKARVYNFSHYYTLNKTSMNESELEELTDLTWLCKRPAFREDQPRVTNLSIVDRINKVSPSIDDALWPCAFISLLHCKFTKTYTSEGLCFTYNNVAAREVFRRGVVRTTTSNTRTVGWDQHTGYDTSVEEPYPARGNLKLKDPHMRLMLRSDILDEDPICNGMTSGYKIYLGHPADVPQTSVYSFSASNDQLTSLAITANIFTSPKSLQHYSVENRQCYFPRERYLRYYKIYTLSNCQAECLSNVTLSLCGCIDYYMPHRAAARVAWCGPSHARCVGQAHYKMEERELRAERAGAAAAGAEGACRCLPACHNIEYDAQPISTEYKLTSFYDDLKNKTKVCVIDLYFKKSKFVSMHRSELFGLTDFVANIGGLLGVFLGFSFLSVVEILYFVFVRIGFTSRNQGDIDNTN